MGHFSYTCQLSGVPITDGTRAVLLPLFPKKGMGYDASTEKLSKIGKGSLITNDGPNLYFYELFFPIWWKDPRKILQILYKEKILFSIK